MADDHQKSRFLEAARKAEADTSDDALDRVFGKPDLKRKLDQHDQKKTTWKAE